MTTSEAESFLSAYERGFARLARMAGPAGLSLVLDDVQGQRAARAAILRRVPGLYKWASAALAFARASSGVADDGQ